MLLWFPTPYPGESLYSLIARYHELSGNYLVCDSHEQLFGDKFQASSTIIPQRLGYLAQQTEPFGLDFNTLLHEHTLYDYFLLFGQEKNRSEVERILRTNSGQAYNTMLGIFGKPDIPRYLRFCPQCMKEEREKYGEAYWHNLHQAPGILCCEKHGCWLVDSSVPVVARATRQYVPLEMVTLYPVRNACDMIKNASDFSRDIEYLWKNRESFRAQWEKFGGSFAECYLALAVEKEWATEGGTLRRQRFLGAIQNRYGERFLEILFASVTGNKPWPITMCQRDKVIQNPVKNILMAKLLCGDMERFLTYIKGLDAPPVMKKVYCYSKVTDLEQLLPYREKWEKLLKENPQSTRNELIQLAPSVHLWLRRHDQDWLLTHYPPPRKRGGNITQYDWGKRDREYLPRIRALSKRWREEQGKPCRITKNRFFRELGIVGALSEYLPQSMKLIDCNIESVQEWDRRRLNWAIREMMKHGEPLIMWKVIRKAGICDARRKENENFLRGSGWLGSQVERGVSGGGV